MKIHVIQTGTVQIKTSQIVGEGHGLRRRLAPVFDRRWSQWLPVYAFAIEHRDGVILVDAGSNAGLMSLPKYHPYFQLAVRFDIDNEQEVGVGLKALGIAAKDIKKVVLTHMHIDHDGGLADLTRSEVLAAPGEIRVASGLRGMIGGYLPQRWPKGFDPRPLDFAPEPFGPFAYSRKVTADGAILAIPTPGHTAHHLSVVVDLGDALAIIGGDAAYSQTSLMGGIVDGVSGDEAAARETLAKLRALAAARPVIFLPTHDPDTPTRLAGMRVAGPKERKVA